MKSLGSANGVEYFQDESGVIHKRIPSIREAIRAEPGRVLVISDFSQIEVKIMAFMSQDNWLISAINSGKDMHCFMASKEDGVGDYAYDLLAAAKNGDILDEALAEILSAERSNVKTVTFGTPYGAGVARIAAMIRRKEKDGRYTESLEDAKVRAQALVDKYFGSARRLYAWLQNQKRIVLTYGFSRCVRGRVRFYPVPDPADKSREAQELIAQIGRWAGNHPIQASCSSMLKVAVAYLYKAIRGGDVCAKPLIDVRLMLVAHDEIILSSSAEDADEAARLLKEAMEYAYNSVSLSFNGVVKYMSEIRNKVKVLTAGYWIKD